MTNDQKIALLTLAGCVCTKAPHSRRAWLIFKPLTMRRLRYGKFSGSLGAEGWYEQPTITNPLIPTSDINMLPKIYLDMLSARQVLRLIE